MVAVRKDGTPRKKLSYEQRIRQTAYLAQNVKKFHGKSLPEITKMLQAEFGDSFDVNTLRRQCQVFKIRYGKPLKASSSTGSKGVNPADVQKLADMLTVIGDVLVIAIQASSLAVDERDKQTMRLIEVSDSLADMERRLAATSKAVATAEKPEEAPPA